MTDTIRAQTLTGYVELARIVGLDPLRMLDAVGIPRVALSQPELRIATTAVRDLLEQSGRAAEDFGLLLSDRRTPSVMGPLALVAREQPTVRGVINALVRYSALHAESLKMHLEETGDIAIIRVVLRFPTPGPCRQGMELTMGQIMRVLRLYLGPHWRPLSVSFVHGAPKAMDSHHRVFGPVVDFDQDFNSIVCSRADMDRQNPGADPEMARQIERYVEGLANAMRADLPERVLELAHALLPMGRCTIHFVARHIGVDPRTLQRQLAERGTSFLDIVQGARMSLTAQYVEESHRPLAEVADLLGFSALSAFSRWHKTHFGCSASDRRAVASAAVGGADR